MTSRIPRVGEVLDVDAALSELYREHDRSCLRLAALLVDDRAAAEDVVQEAFVKVYRSWRKIRDPQAAPAYLRSTVLNTARSGLGASLATGDGEERIETPVTEPEPSVVPAVGEILVQRDDGTFVFLSADGTPGDTLVLPANPQPPPPVVAIQFGTDAKDLWLLTGAGSASQPFAWSDDGALLAATACGADDCAVSVWDADRLDPRFPASASPPRYGGEAPAFLGGDLVVHTSVDVAPVDPPRTEAIDLATGERRFLLQVDLPLRAILPDPSGTRLLLLAFDGTLFRWDGAGDPVDLATGITAAAWVPTGRGSSR